MKLNENGDFCLLYVEPADEKQRLFEVISVQSKPVVLMLPQVAGQPRSRLFQRPEDFNDLKHVRRQSGLPITFLTANSSLLAQMAARHGFTSYASIDALAEALTHGRRADTDGHEIKAQPSTVRRARTGPLQPPSAQIAALRRPTPTAPLNTRAANAYWPSPQSGSLPLASTEAAPAPTAPLNAPADLAFWPAHDSLPGVPTTPPSLSSVRATPVPSGRLPNYAPPTFQASEYTAPVEEPQRFSDIPRRRSAHLADEAYSRHPGWEPEAEEEESAPPLMRERSQVHEQVRRAAAARSLAETSVPRLRTPPLKTEEDLSPIAPPASHTGRTRRSVLPVLIILSLLILAGAGLGSLVVISHNTPAAPVVVRPVGSITFQSSEQLNQSTSQGIDDQVQINLHNLASPAAGKSDYAWLLGDKNKAESQSILLGKLTIINGTATLFYTGDAQHTNLLQITSRFLVTEEASGSTPLLPSPDTSNWRYYGALPAVPDPNDAHHFAFLNHLRHLLADEPILDEMELPGGLNNWFTRNTEKLIEWTSGARDRWQDTHDLTFVRDQGIAILSYLDGMSFLVQDLPPASSNVQVTLDTHLAGLGLLNVRGTGQNPPSYMDQMVYHLNGLLNAPGSPTNVRSLASSILPAMSNVITWLQSLRSDDKKLLAMSNDQLKQPAALSLLDDMVLQASNAYTGTTDTTTGQLKQGVVWIHQQLQSMATINISTYSAGSSVPEIGPSSQNAPAFVSPLLSLWMRLKELL